MATFASFLSFSSHPSLQIASLSLRRRFEESSVSVSFFKPIQRSDASGSSAIRVSASSDSSSSFSASGFGAGGESSRSKKSALFKLVQDIEPLDVSLIQKDVPPTTIDAMKRTISGMLGLLPSDQFQVTVDALWEPIFKLFISSMTTGYTLRNAEYRLSLERNLEWDVKTVDQSRSVVSDVEADVKDLNDDRISGHVQQENLPKSDETREANYGIPDFGEMTPEAREYILKLHSSLSSVKKELHEVKRKSEALQMQQFVGEEKNDLLDYLRSLEPEKVAELSEPTSPELKATIHSVVHGLLATLSPKMHSKGPDLGENGSIGSLNVEEAEGEHIDLVENTSLLFQPLISLPRDYLARLLFWCMLLGHYLRSLEYRLELVELLSMSCSSEGSTE